MFGIDSLLPSTPTVEFENVGKRFRLQEGNTLTEFIPSLLKGRGWAEPFWALRDISFQVYKGETLGIMGRNGSGKSTILKLAARVMVPTTGRVSVRGRVCPLIELAAGFHADLTGRENIHLKASLLGLSNAEVRERTAAIVAFSELEEFIETPVKRYSSGMYMRLAFSIAAHSNPDILLVDEALAVGDAAFQEKCLDRMEELKDGGVTTILASHSEKVVQRFCNRVMLIETGHVRMIGEPREVIAEYARSAGHHVTQPTLTPVADPAAAATGGA
jgi:lipopolysaccharide transport system ATP-binding protein